MSPHPITDVYPFNKQCALNVDYQGQEYRVCWLGDWRKPPDLSLFPSLDGATCSHIPHGSRVNELWSASQVVRHGSDSHIRELRNCTDGFPICKVAINERQRRLVQDEFLLLQYLSTLPLNLPVVRICSIPLQDEQGIFGFQMERLCDIAFENLAEYVDEIGLAVKAIHEAGVIHYDLSMSNIMLSIDGHITLIDFGRAGYVGDWIPMDKEKGAKVTGKQIYSESWDFEAIQYIQSLTEKSN